MSKIKTNRASSVLNILGMTIAFAAFYVIMSQVMFDLTYNSCIKNADNKYLITGKWYETLWSLGCPIPMTEKVTNEIPGAKVGFFVLCGTPGNIYVGEGAEEKKYSLTPQKMEPGFAELLQMEFVAGAFPETDGDVAISTKAAEVMSVSVGDMIYVYDSNEEMKCPATVTGIYKAFARNSDFHKMDIAWNRSKEILSSSDNYWGYSGIVSLESAEDKVKFEELWTRTHYELTKKQAGENVSEEQILLQAHKCKLTSLSEIHTAPIGYSGLPHAQVSVSSILMQIGIALLIVVIAFINFVNFFVALVPEKMRSVNIRKVFGASRGSLIWIFVREALIYVGMAIALAIIVLLALVKSSLNEYVDGGIALDKNVLAFIVLIVTAVVFSVLSAFFPAMYVTKVDAAIGVKSGFSHSFIGRVLRKILITIQLAAAVSMVIISAVFYMQYQYMTKQDLGFDKENLYEVQVFPVLPELKSRIEGIAGIKSVTAGSGQFLWLGGGMQNFKYEDKEVMLNIIQGMPNYLEVMGIPLLSGNGFSPNNNRGTIIVDVALKDVLDEESIETALHNYGINLVGFASHINTKLMNDREDKGIMAYRTQGYDFEYYSTIFFRTEKNADIKAIIPQVQSIVKEKCNYDQLPSVSTPDEELALRYARFKKQSIIVGLFSLIAIVIALMGVFGIVMFETEHRRHETAVRKVMGAESLGIVSLFCKQYLCIVLLSCLIATPIANLVTEQWLQQFTSQVNVPVWIYVAAYAIVSFLTLGIIALKTVNAAKENPIENLKTE